MGDDRIFIMVFQDAWVMVQILMNTCQWMDEQMKA